MPSNRRLDDNGYLSVQGCPISSYGIFDYSAAQLGLEGDPQRIVKVFRPEESITDPEAIASFRNVPLIDDHAMLHGADEDGGMAPEQYGIRGVLTDVYYDAPWMRGDIKVFARDLQQKLQNGKKELSLGYSCDFDSQPGVWNGQPYEVVQTNLRGNHIALVDQARVPGARVLDGRSMVYDHLSFDPVPNSTGDSSMKRRSQAFDNAVEQLLAIIPALKQFLTEEAQEPAHEGATPAAQPAATPVEATQNDADPVVTPVAAAAPVDPAAAAADPAAVDPDATDPAAQPDVSAVIAEVEALLAKLKAAMGDPASEQTPADPDPSPAETEDGDEETSEEAEDGTEPGAAGVDPDTDPSTPKSASDEENPVGKGQGTASTGPRAGINAKAGDAALRRFHADLALKTRLYDGLSKVVGAFDHAAMDASAVAVYGVRKLKLKNVAAGHEVAACDAYITATAAAKVATKQTIQQRKAADTAETSKIDAYIQGAQ